MSRKYLELGTESLSRWGTAVWIHRQRGILACDGRPVCVDEHDIEVFAESPKLLSLKVSVAGVCVFVIAAHCPHEAKGAEYVTFLEHLEQQLQRTQGADLVLCGIDLNGPGEGPLDLWCVVSQMSLGSASPSFLLACVCGPQPPSGRGTLVKIALLSIRLAVSAEVISLLLVTCLQGWWTFQGDPSESFFVAAQIRSR